MLWVYVSTHSYNLQSISKEPFLLQMSITPNDSFLQWNVKNVSLCWECGWMYEMGVKDLCCFVVLLFIYIKKQN